MRKIKQNYKSKVKEQTTRFISRELVLCNVDLGTFGPEQNIKKGLKKEF